MVPQVNRERGISWLERLMEVSSPSPGLPPSRFHCRLAGQPDHLFPQRCLQPQTLPRLPAPALCVNPDVGFTRAGELPAAFTGRAELLENFALQGPIAWVQQTGSRSLQPFWLEPEWAGMLQRCKPGERAPSALPAEARNILALANVLVEEESIPRRARDWLALSSHLGEQFHAKGYAPIGQLIHPLHVAALRRYYRYLIRTGGLRLGDVQSSRRYVAHNESVARFFHHQLASIVSAIVGEAVKPSYVYLGSYQGGAKLEKHTDREQCEFSITFCLDYSPEPRHETRWPIHLYTPTSYVTVFQGLGDGLLYRGRELPHARDPLPQSHTSTSLFFHYVRENFSGTLD